MKKLLSTLTIIAINLIAINASFAQLEFTKGAISIGVVVEDLDESVAFYTKVVGMKHIRDFSVDSEKAVRMGLSEGEQFDVKVLQLEEGDQATELKLMTFNKKTNLKKQKFIPQSNGIRYVTIFINSMQPLIERIEAHDVKFMGETPTMLDENRQFVLIQDPDGNFVEFIGPK